MSGLVADPSPPTIVGLLPDGIGVDLGKEIGLRVRDRVEELAQGTTVRSLRMVPSTVTHVQGDVIEFVANATVVPARPDPTAPPVRSKVIDSVVTVDLGAARDKIRSVSCPFLE